MKQAELSSHSVMNTTKAYSARDCRRRLHIVAEVLFSVTYTNPLGLVSIHPSISIDFFTITFKYLPLRQGSLHS